MRAIVIAPVPTPNSDRLVMISEVSPRNPDDQDFDRLAPANLLDWQRQTQTLEHIAAFAWWDVNITGIDEPERADGGERLPDGVEVHDRLGGPRPRLRSVRVAAPEVDHRLVVNPDRERRPDLEPRREDLRERLAQRLEGRRAPPVNHVDHQRSSQTSCMRPKL